jgi:hypothetical protein
MADFSLASHYVLVETGARLRVSLKRTAPALLGLFGFSSMSLSPFSGLGTTALGLNGVLCFVLSWTRPCTVLGMGGHLARE